MLGLLKTGSHLFFCDLGCENLGMLNIAQRYSELRNLHNQCGPGYVLMLSFVAFPGESHILNFAISTESKGPGRTHCLNRDSGAAVY